MAEAGVIFERGGITFSGRTGGGATPGGAGGGGGGAAEPAGFTKQNRITQIQWDSTNHTIQFKKGNVLVEDGSEDAEWTDLVDFEDYDV